MRNGDGRRLFHWPEATGFHKTMLNEFYRVGFRKKIYRTLDELQSDCRWCYGKDADANVYRQCAAGGRPSFFALR